MKIKVGDKVWVSSAFKYKKVVEIEEYDSVDILYMEDKTSYSNQQVFLTFWQFFKSIIHKFFKKKKKENKNEELAINFFFQLSEEERDAIFLMSVKKSLEK